MDDKRLDQILDSALNDLLEGEPLSGLEERVLSRVPFDRPRKKRGAWVSLGLVVSSAVVIVTMLDRSEQLPSPPKPQLVARSPIPVFPGAPPFPKRSIKRRGGVRHTLPKQEQFPSPSPLTGEERALIALVRKDGPAAAAMLAELKSRADEPINIQPIQIQPISNMESENQ